MGSLLLDFLIRISWAEPVGDGLYRTIPSSLQQAIQRFYRAFIHFPAEKLVQHL